MCVSVRLLYSYLASDASDASSVSAPTWAGVNKEEESGAALTPTNDGKLQVNRRPVQCKRASVRAQSSYRFDRGHVRPVDQFQAQELAHVTEVSSEQRE